MWKKKIFREGWRGRFVFSSLNIPKMWVIYTSPVFSTVYLSGAHEELCEETGNRSQGLKEILLTQDEMKALAECGQELTLPGEAEQGKVALGVPDDCDQPGSGVTNSLCATAPSKSRILKWFFTPEWKSS